MTIEELEADDGAVNLTSEVAKSFDLLDVDGTNSVSSLFMTNFMKRTGFNRDDIRLKGMYEYLDSINATDDDVALTLP